MEQAIVFMAGVNFLILGLSYFFHSDVWIAWIISIQKQKRRGSLIIGMIHLLIGTFILGFHWKWQGIALVLSMVGVFMVIKGTLYMLFPSLLPKLLAWLEPHYRALLLFGSFILIIIALVAFYEWRQIAMHNYHGYNFNQTVMLHE